MPKNYLLIINEAPYGNERSYNALRLALELLKFPETTVKVFLLGDGTQCAQAHHETPQGYYNIERMLHSVATRGTVYAWASCAKARGIGPQLLVEGVDYGSMDILAQLTIEADKVLVF